MENLINERHLHNSVASSQAVNNVETVSAEDPTSKTFLSPAEGVLCREQLVGEQLEFHHAPNSKLEPLPVKEVFQHRTHDKVPVNRIMSIVVVVLSTHIRDISIPNVRPEQ